MRRAIKRRETIKGWCRKGPRRFCGQRSPRNSSYIGHYGLAMSLLCMAESYLRVLSRSVFLGLSHKAIVSSFKSLDLCMNAHKADFR